MPFTLADSNARLSFASAPPSGAGFLLNHRCTVATESSPAAT